jgi:O-antigen/teichoic acid export membrane protein
MQYLSLGETYWYRKRSDFYLWTIRRQNHISTTIRTQLMSVVFFMLLLSILLPIRLETALYIIFYTGLAVIGLLWALIERRRSWLLGIQDPVLKEAAHQAMIFYLEQRRSCGRPQSQCGDGDCACTDG